MPLDFNDNLKLTFTGSGRPYRENEVWVRTQVFNKRYGLLDHEYFAFKLPPETTDGASIPRICWLFLAPFDNRILNPSQPHDHLYAKKEKVLNGYIWNKVTGLTTGELTVTYDRLDADKMIEEKMKSYGAGPIVRKGVFVAVRLGGKKGYNT